MTDEERRSQLDRLKIQYDRQGYSFSADPDPSTLPAFMKGYQPDAIALGSPQNIAIEIQTGRRSPGEMPLREVAERFAGRTDWELRVVYSIEDKDWTIRSSVPSIGEIEDQLLEAERLATSQHERAALVIAWAALEAAASRSDLLALGRIVEGPQQLLQALEGRGLLSFEEADALRKRVALRNAAVHGNYANHIDATDVAVVVNSVRSLMQNLTVTA